jgi:hypothetical protein
LNRDDEFYNTVKNMKRPEYRRKRKWPTVEEFWDLETPIEFRLLADDQSDWKKFRRWLTKYLRTIEGQPDFDYDK